ncbi:hypothetical protein RO3G_03974 [Rhizopus delemar RA 99-880]|uniref:Uncharacterized protein n=1 Tax=Rhizopus delemar (strain RA 99-880 / ATCC MYA-4621 / FGSC 9543 / NRRL 43880) TaxID=246409 RepID=I1BST9_RHIO9|nr:hypothetical protein RO3G_03974 [Rhizopus delemar RA 99-880]|eukprot:EIE79269.1 hypothetical protein RO3G_03974 [Rhizopus delemar RA 99-880]
MALINNALLSGSYHQIVVFPLFRMNTAQYMFDFLTSSESNVHSSVYLICINTFSEFNRPLFFKHALHNHVAYLQ